MQTVSPSVAAGPVGAETTTMTTGAFAVTIVISSAVIEKANV